MGPKSLALIPSLLLLFNTFGIYEFSDKIEGIGG
jgi:hypothetical protein